MIPEVPAFATGSGNRVQESDLYSKEELVAQIGSQFLLNQFGIIPKDEAEIDNDIAYIKGWAEHLEDNRTEIVKASYQAQKAVEYFISTAERHLEKDFTT